MNARKLVDDFRLWALRQPVVRNELSAAREEFFAFHDQKEAERLQLVQGLFLEWFLFDRPLNSWLKTPAALYPDFPRTRLNESERAAAVALTSSVFGLFEVIGVDPARGHLEMKSLSSSQRWLISEARGSQTMKKGELLFARLIPFPGAAILSGWTAGYPDHQKAFRQGVEEALRGGSQAPSLKPRDVLVLFMPKISWESRGPEACRARMSSLWQRAAPNSPSWKEFEAALANADEASYRNGLARLCDALPSADMVGGVVDVAWAWWNTASGKARGLPTPLEQMGGREPGPIEERYLRMSVDAVREKIHRNGELPGTGDIDEWMSDPANGEGGLSPKELISQERRQLGIPESEPTRYHLDLDGFEDLTSRQKEAEDWAREATKVVQTGKFGVAMTLYAKAWPMLKDDRRYKFRLLGNMAICMAFLGERQKAIGLLQKALQVNPDYAVARRNLAHFQSMSDAEYDEFCDKGVAALLPYKAE